MRKIRIIPIRLKKSASVDVDDIYDYKPEPKKCPKCKRNLRKVYTDQFDKTGDVYFCKRCNKQYRGYQLEDDYVYQPGYP